MNMQRYNTMPAFSVDRAALKSAIAQDQPKQTVTVSTASPAPTGPATTAPTTTATASLGVNRTSSAPSMATEASAAKCAQSPPVSAPLFSIPTSSCAVAGGAEGGPSSPPMTAPPTSQYFTTLPREGFASKIIERHSNRLFRCSMVSMVGLRDTMEDTHCAVLTHENSRKGGMGLFGVFDGHGGKECAQFVANTFPRAILDYPASPIPDSALISICNHIDAQYLRSTLSTSGSTAAFAIVTPLPNGLFDIHLGNIGDARVLVGHKSGKMFTTVDHKPSDEAESARIHSAGGRVTNNRVDGLLAVSRAFGDRHYKEQGKVITTPSLAHVQAEKDDFIIIACDGLFDKAFTSEKLVDFARFHLKNGKEAGRVMAAACDEALRQGSPDNMTVCVIQLGEGRSGKRREFLPGPYLSASPTSRLAYLDTVKLAGISLGYSVECRYDQLRAELAALRTHEAQTVYTVQTTRDVQTELLLFGSGPPPEMSGEERTYWFESFVRSFKFQQGTAGKPYPPPTSAEMAKNAEYRSALSASMTRDLVGIGNSNASPITSTAMKPAISPVSSATTAGAPPPSVVSCAATQPHPHHHQQQATAVRRAMSPTPNTASTVASSYRSPTHNPNRAAHGVVIGKPPLSPEAKPVQMSRPPHSRPTITSRNFDLNSITSPEPVGPRPSSRFASSESATESATAEAKRYASAPPPTASSTTATSYQSQPRVMTHSDDPLPPQQQQHHLPPSQVAVEKTTPRRAASHTPVHVHPFVSPKPSDHPPATTATYNYSSSPPNVNPPQAVRRDSPNRGGSGSGGPPPAPPRTMMSGASTPNMSTKPMAPPISGVYPAMHQSMSVPSHSMGPRPSHVGGYTGSSGTVAGTLSPPSPPSPAYTQMVVTRSASLSTGTSPSSGGAVSSVRRPLEFQRAPASSGSANFPPPSSASRLSGIHSIATPPATSGPPNGPHHGGGGSVSYQPRMSSTITSTNASKMPPHSRPRPPPPPAPPVSLVTR